MADPTIFVVDDEPSILTLVEFNLRKAGYHVVTLTDGRYVIELAERDMPDLIILDVMLPGVNGFELCKKFRQQGYQLPILMLTARDEEMDKVLGLELGADDYLTKPFSPRELVARVKALLRRIQTEGEAVRSVNSSVLVIGELRVDTERYEVEMAGRPLDLTPKEFEILCYMMGNTGKVVTREQLLHAVWNYDYAGDTRIVDVHVSHLRDKIEPDPKQPRYIRTIRGIGYKLERPKE